MDKVVLALFLFASMGFFLLSIQFYFETEWTHYFEYRVNSHSYPPALYHPYRIYTVPTFVVGIFILIIGLKVSTRKREIE